MASTGLLTPGRKRVGIDIDGTLAMFHETFIVEYNAIHKTQHTVEDFNSYSKWNIPIGFPDFMKIYDEIWTKRWKTIKPSIPESTINLLMSAYDVDIITHRPKGHEPYLRKWLDLYFPHAQSSLGIRITESSEAKTLHDHDILFDDAPPLAEELIKRGKTRPLLFLVTQPWNRNENYEQHRNIIKRVKTLGEGIALLVRTSDSNRKQSSKSRAVR